MKGLVTIPTSQDLQAVYERLQGGNAQPVDAKTLAQWGRWSRFDPRLAEQLVTYVASHWQDYNPLELNAAVRGGEWPAVMGVLLRQVSMYASLSRAKRKRFAAWADCVMTDIAPADGEMFFIGLRSFAGPLVRKDAELSLKSYSAWGYLGREVLVNKALSQSPRTDLSPTKRRTVLKQLLREQKRITVHDYMTALGGCISRRQAQLDLANANLSSSGNTRNRVFFSRKKTLSTS